MDIIDYFRNFKENQAKRKLAKLTRRLCEKYAQDYDRMSAAEELDQMEGEKAIFALLQRFQVQTPKIIEDEEEKKIIFEMVLRKGVRAIDPILRYIREKENLAYPLRLLSRLAGPEATRKYLLEILGEFTPEYDRAPEKKIDVIHAMSEYQGTDIIAAMLPFLHDPDDDVVMACLDALAAHREEEDRIREAFLDLLVEEEEKPRVKRRVMELFKDLHWKVAGYRKKVEDLLPIGFYLDKKGYVKQQGDE